ncbi:MAG: penicillin acylase family protein [Pseudomonadota bacterium]
MMRLYPGHIPLSLVTFAVALVLGGCAILQGPPGPVTADARLSALPTQGLPVERPVEIRWSDRMVPFITAETDGDAAFALGLVHAHLRLGQMAIARQVTQGRISEMAGPFTTDIDAALRAFDFGRAAPEILAAMPPETRTWMDRYVEGINFYADRIPDDAWPHEFAVGGLDWEPWTAEDTIRLGRASGIDINWGVWISLLQIEDSALRERALGRLVGLSRDGRATFGDSDRRFAGLEPFEQIVELGTATGKSGSNSFVLSPERSASGAALIANDPHLGFFIPNVWLIAGLRSPSYEVVGMMVPGTPVFGFGRTPHLAWGGTNLRATTSELVDVSDLPPDAIETIDHDIGVRFWFDEHWQTRRTKYGPIMSGITELFGETPDFAINWVGHRVTDETTALLGAMKARGFEDFRTAMKDFALPSQTFLVATRDGTIASMIATGVPARPENDPLRVIASPERTERHWQRVVSGDQLPFEVNPPEGFLASANNRPTADESTPYGGTFPQDERVRRIVEILQARSDWTAEDLAAVQMDAVSPLSRELIAAVRERLIAAGQADPAFSEAVELIVNWDGDYAVDSRAAPVFEAFAERFVRAAYDGLGRAEEAGIYLRFSRARRLLLDDLPDLDDAGWGAALAASLPAAAEVAAEGTRWGDIHRIAVGHVLSRIPYLGEPYLERLVPVPGAKETIFKTAHSPSDAPHVATFGAQARHVSDMADPDANHFVLFGGQDGWIGSPAFSDQVPLWRTGRLVQVPMTPEAVRAAHPLRMMLQP